MLGTLPSYSLKTPFRTVSLGGRRIIGKLRRDQGCESLIPSAYPRCVRRGRSAIAQLYHRTPRSACARRTPSRPPLGAQDPLLAVFAADEGVLCLVAIAVVVAIAAVEGVAPFRVVCVEVICARPTPQLIAAAAAAACVQLIVTCVARHLVVAGVAVQLIVASAPLYGVVAAGACDLIHLSSAYQAITAVGAHYGLCQRHPGNHHQHDHHGRQQQSNSPQNCRSFLPYLAHYSWG